MVWNSAKVTNGGGFIEQLMRKSIVVKMVRILKILHVLSKMTGYLFETSATVDVNSTFWLLSSG